MFKVTIKSKTTIPVERDVRPGVSPMNRRSRDMTFESSYRCGQHALADDLHEEITAEIAAGNVIESIHVEHIEDF